MAYATTDDVLFPFPRFKKELPNNISTLAIQSWLDEGKAEIRARFLRRGLDPDAPGTLGWTPPLVVLTDDQANILRRFNAAYGIWRLGEAAFTAFNEGELKLVTAKRQEWESMSGNTDASGMGLAVKNRYILGNDGVYDALFSPSASHVQIAPQFKGMAGADYDPRLINNRTQGTFFFFEKAQKF